MHVMLRIPNLIFDEKYTHLVLSLCCTFCGETYHYCFGLQAKMFDVATLGTMTRRRVAKKERKTRHPGIRCKNLIEALRATSGRRIANPLSSPFSNSSYYP